MDGKISTYAEFSNPEAAAQAVRALKAAGFDDIATEDLSYSLNSSTDAGSPPIKKCWRYSAAGFVLGGIVGMGLGLLVFGAPAMVFNVPYSGVLALVGLILCIGVGSVIGMEQAYVMSGRHSSAPTSVVAGHPVGVCVSTERNGARLVRAREILSMYTEELSLRERRWWQLRRWAHTLGT